MKDGGSPGKEKKIIQVTSGRCDWRWSCNDARLLVTNPYLGSVVGARAVGWVLKGWWGIALNGLTGMGGLS